MGSFERFDEEQRLFVVDEGGGYTCLGLDNARRTAIAVSEWLAGRVPGIGAIGPVAITPDEKGWLAYRLILDAGAAYNARTGERCEAELTPQLRGLEGRWVEVVDCYGERRRFMVGKSTGWLPIHLEIEQGESGGPGVTGAPFRSVVPVPRPPGKRRRSV